MIIHQDNCGEALEFYFAAPFLILTQGYLKQSQDELLVNIHEKRHLSSNY